MALQQDILTFEAHCAKMKTEWPEGPWTSEPNRLEFKHAGHDCLLVRHDHFGNWCGYVAVESSHPDFGKDYHDIMREVAVHGGLTYSEGCQGIVCHAADEVKPVHWFGFDCGHSCDLKPGYLKYESELPGLDLLDRYRLGPQRVYRDLEFITREVKDLAEQLAARKT